MGSDEKIVRTPEEVYNEMLFISEHFDDNDDQIKEAWQASLLLPYSPGLISTLASTDVERFLVAFRRIARRDAEADSTRYVVVSS
jgi:hypothetical protein